MKSSGTENWNRAERKTKNVWFSLLSGKSNVLINILILDTWVELEGLEPSSKRGINELSTCLVFTWFSWRGRPKTTNLILIPCYFGQAAGPVWPISDLPALPIRSVSEKGQSGNVLSLQLLRRLSVIYCSSIRQQERSYFRQLTCWCLCLKSVAIIALHAYCTASSRCQNQSAPFWETASCEVGDKYNYMSPIMQVKF